MNIKTRLVENIGDTSPLEVISIRTHQKTKADLTKIAKKMNLSLSQLINSTLEIFLEDWKNTHD